MNDFGIFDWAVAGLGFIFVFVVLLIAILYVAFQGLLLKRFGKKPSEKDSVSNAQMLIEEDDAEIVAVMAAVAALYNEAKKAEYAENPNTEFVVKRIIRK